MESLVNTTEGRIVIKRLLKAEMQEHGMRYADLAQGLLEEFDVVQSESNLRQKINKGTLGAQLFLQLLVVMRTRMLDLGRVRALFAEVKAVDDPA